MKKLIEYIKKYQKIKVFFLDEYTYKDLINNSEQIDDVHDKDRHFVFETDLVSIMFAWELYDVEILFVDESNLDKGVIVVVVSDVEQTKKCINDFVINTSFDPDETAKELSEVEKCKKQKSYS